MNVVDSSGWIEYLSGGSNASFFQTAIEARAELLVPTLSLFEVYRHLLRYQGREEALRVVGAMRRGTVLELDDRIALEAAEVSVEEQLALADSILLATARLHDATFWTQDADFEGFDGVKYSAKQETAGETS